MTEYKLYITSMCRHFRGVDTYEIYFFLSSGFMASGG
jgi:hypothetical protein